ncbi:MAG: glucose-1-phosphate cytidylyltransferase [Chloroflexota bacterium]|nr:glucose-1-phosphate cytidylyltransferase [Chloroflexota bacterium]
MKAVILAGGLGSRLSEETTLKPKPMVEVGGKPILWHIMKIYAAHGVEEFLVCLGYKGYVIKEWFANYALHTSDVTFDMCSGEMEVHHSTTEPWRVTLVETGDETMTGGRLKRVLPYIGDETFCLTYGDGVADIDVAALIAYHREQGRLATVTAVQPPGRFGALELEGARVDSFAEKPRGDGAWINGGFFVCEPAVGEMIAGDDTKWEEEPLHGLAARSQLTVYRHRGFWQAMDTLRERHELESLWESARAPWKTWA